jgi:MYXO-CTERM domain-containing protein
MRPRALLVGAGVALLLTARAAPAQDTRAQDTRAQDTRAQDTPAQDPPARDTQRDGVEIDRVEAELEAALAELASDDCSIACRALESMIRSAERICELEPGERCEAARRKVADAKRRVRDACPDCAAAASLDALEPEPLPGPVQAYGKGGPAPAPPAESGGGCASCSVGRAHGRPLALWLLALAVIVRRYCGRKAKR